MITFTPILTVKQAKMRLYDQFETTFIDVEGIQHLIIYTLNMIKLDNIKAIVIKFIPATFACKICNPDKCFTYSNIEKM